MQEKQWISKVLRVSSQFSNCPASNLIGEPRFYPQYGDSTETWTPSSRHYHEWLEIQFDLPVLINSINIYETCDIGAVSKIFARTYENSWVLIYDCHQDQQWLLQNKNDSSSSDCSSASDNDDDENDEEKKSRIFTPILLPIASSTCTNILRLEFNKHNHWNMHIDAIQLIGQYSPSNKKSILDPVTCSRCKQEYHLFKNQKDECIHHPGNFYLNTSHNLEPFEGAEEYKWTCCGDTNKDAPGCIATPHL